MQQVTRQHVHQFETVIHVWDNKDWMEVTKQCECGALRISTQRKGEADLFRAAPDMLAALKNLRNRLQWPSPPISTETA